MIKEKGLSLNYVNLLIQSNKDSAKMNLKDDILRQELYLDAVERSGEDCNCQICK